MAGKTTTKAANHLRAWRESYALTQTQLAARMDQHSSVVSELEAGRKQLTDKWLRRLAEALADDLHPALLLFDPHDPVTDLIRAAMRMAPRSPARPNSSQL